MSPLARTVDSMLEALIAPSFTRIGYDTRSRLEQWRAISDYDLTGRTIVITGATSGLGEAAADLLADAGATIVAVARNPARAAEVTARWTGSRTVLADLSDLDQVREAGQQIARIAPRIDALVHCAGALDHEYAAGPQGYERTVTTHVLAPFLLTSLLVDSLRAAAPSRIVWVTSGGMYTEPLDVEHLEMGPGHYNGTVAYARAKRAQMVLTELWGDRLNADQIAVHAMHPGWADTPGVRHSLPTFRRIVGPLLRTPMQGADTIAWLCADPLPLATTGELWLDRHQRRRHRLSRTRAQDTAAERAKLWNWCYERAGR